MGEQTDWTGKGQQRLAQLPLTHSLFESLLPTIQIKSGALLRAARRQQ